jgi:hypothetical protein
MDMKILKSWVGLIAFCGMTLFLTACGGDDDDEVTVQIVSPENLSGRTYTLSGTGPTSVTFSGNTYVLLFSGTNNFGTYVANRTGNSVDVALTNPEQTWTRQLVLNFNSPTAGSYIYREPGQVEPNTGTFVQGGAPAPAPSGSNNNPGGGGSGGGNNNNSSTNNPATAPATLRAVTIHTSAGSVSGVSDYTVQLTGASSGTFTASNNTSGNFIYEVINSTTAHLRLNYGGQFTGDYDDMTLNFANAVITGTQIYNGTGPGAINGTFTGAQ